MRFGLCIPVIVSMGISSAHAAEAPAAPLEAATSCSTAHEALLASFTLTYVRDNAVTLRARYDAGADAWEVLEEPAGKEAEEDRIAFAELREEMRGPGALLADEEFEAITSLSLLEETSKEYVYSFVPGDEGEDPMPEKMREAIDGRLAIDKKTGCLTDLSMQSTKAFKPAAIAKVDSFLMRYSFTRVGARELPLFSSFTTDISGSAMFRPFSEQLQLSVSDVTILE